MTASATTAAAGSTRPRRVLPVLEVLTLAVMLITPFALDSRPELVTLATNILILSILALSFELCWGYSGIMSFGQALFFGVPAYVIALVGRDLEFSHIWGTLPLAMLVGLVLSTVFAAFLLLGRRTPTPIFIALGTLTGAYAAERLVSGWQYVGAGNGLSSIKLLQAGEYEFVEGTAFYFSPWAACSPPPPFPSLPPTPPTGPASGVPMAPASPRMPRSPSSLANRVNSPGKSPSIRATPPPSSPGDASTSRPPTPTARNAASAASPSPPARNSGSARSPVAPPSFIPKAASPPARPPSTPNASS